MAEPAAEPAHTGRPLMAGRAKPLVLNTLKAGGLVPVVRADSADLAVRVAEALVEGGIRTIEITMTVPDALQAIRSVASRFGQEVLLGAGTGPGPSMVPRGPGG